MAFSSRSLWLIGGLFLLTLIGGFYLSAPASDVESSSASAAPAISPVVADTATFAGGCFWCMEPPYDKIDGVASTTSGFAGGEMVDPSYQQVASGATEHTEVVQVVYDSTAVSYERLLRVYWHNVDPFDGTGQFCDRGSQYRPAIFAHDAQQQRSAERSKVTVAAQFDRDIAVQVQSLDAFYAAEQYHQNYYQKNPADYKRYRQGCGRDARLREVWGEAALSDAPLDGTT